MDDEFFADIFFGSEELSSTENTSAINEYSSSSTIITKDKLIFKSPPKATLSKIPSFLSQKEVDDFDLESDLPDWTSIQTKNIHTKTLIGKPKNDDKSIEPSNNLQKSLLLSQGHPKNINGLNTSFRNEPIHCVNKSVHLSRSVTEDDANNQTVLNDSALNESLFNANRIKRKFPGPAGLLPQLPTDQVTKLSQFVKVKKSEENLNSDLESVELPCSQVDENEFNQSPWLQVMHDLQLNSCSSPLSKYNISWLLRKASLKQLPNSKIPVLVAVIKLINTKTVLASTILKDKTGEIAGTIDQQLIEEFKSVLKVGTVLILQNVSVLSPSKKKHYLIITPKNIARIYITRENNCVECLRLVKGDLNAHLINIAGSSEAVSIENNKEITSPTSNSTANSIQKSNGTLKVQQLYNVVGCSSPIVNQQKNNSPKTIIFNEVDWGDDDDDYDEIMKSIDEQQLINTVCNKVQTIN